MTTLHEPRPICEADVYAAVDQLRQSATGRQALQSLKVWLRDDGLRLDGCNQAAVVTLLDAAWGPFAGTVLAAMSGEADALN